MAPTRGLARVDQGGMCGLALVPLPLSPARGGVFEAVLPQFQTKVVNYWLTFSVFGLSV